MITVHKLDAQNVFVGSVECDPMGPLPVPCVMVAPPDTSGSEVARWDGSGWEVLPSYPVVAAQDVAHLKVFKNTEINSARLAANFSTFTHAGKAFACDQLSRSDIDATNGFVAIYGALPPGWPGGWKAVDNTYLPIATVADWKVFYSSMFAAGSANFAHTQALKSQLDAATTADEVAAIRW